MKKLFSQFRELWFYPTVSLGLLAGSLYFAKYVSHRPVVTDPDNLFAFAGNVAALFFVAIFVVTVDSWFFNDLDKEGWDKASIWEKVLDVCKTIVIFGLSLWFVHSS